MGKLRIIIATMATLLLVVVDGSIYRVGQGERCEEQLKQAGQLSGCLKYVRHRMRAPGRYTREFPPSQFECCDQLQNVDPQCVCQSLEMVLDQLRQQEELVGDEEQQALSTAQNIPSLCRLPQPRRCDFRSLYVD